MRKFIDITEEVEKSLIAVLDHALKGGGMAAMGVVNHILQSVKSEQDRSIPVVSPSEIKAA